MLFLHALRTSQPQSVAAQVLGAGDGVEHKANARCQHKQPISLVAFCASEPAALVRVPNPSAISTAQETISDTQTAPGIPDNLAQPGGILSTDADQSPIFATWNHVYVWYCTSDSSLGEAPFLCALYCGFFYKG